MKQIWIDADACPVKAEVDRVAQRYQWKVTLVANAWLNVTETEWRQLIVVRGHLDAADDWIAEHCERGDVVITADIPLAARCLEKEARVLDPRGSEFSEASIGSALASRELMQHLRDTGLEGSGPAPFRNQDRSQFLQSLDRVIQALRRDQERE